MRVARRTYTIVTNACLALGVASAFGFDRTGHITWLVIGGSAAVAAFAIYLVQQWEVRARAESQSLVPVQSQMMAVEPWVMKVQHHTDPVRRTSAERTRPVTYWTKGPLPPVRVVQAGRHIVVERPPSTGELVSELVKQLQKADNRHARELIVRTDGSIIVRLSEDIEQPETASLDPLSFASLRETVH